MIAILTLYRSKSLQTNPNKLEQQTIEQIAEFVKTFGGIKVALMNFISKYAKPQTALNKEFITTFKVLVGVVVKRIEFEENNLYKALAKE